MKTEFEKFKAVVDTEFVKISENISSLREDLIKSTDTQSPDNSWVQIVNQKVEDKFGSLTGKVECINKSITEVKAATEEEVDKENRRNNIVLYTVGCRKVARHQQLREPIQTLGSASCCSRK